MWRAILVLTFVANSSVQAQNLPDVFENLEVLPAYIEKDSLQAVMNEFKFGLGVGCQHCHLWIKDERRWDYVSDEKEAKRISRDMLRMTNDLNATYIAALGRETVMRVRCETCHRGQQRPETLVDVIQTALKAGGVDSVVTRHRELREKSNGQGPLDFRERYLVSYAYYLDQAGEHDVAVRLLHMNAENYPSPSQTYTQLGFIHQAAEEPKEALRAFEKAYELDPKKWIKRLIEKLQEPKSD